MTEEYIRGRDAMKILQKWREHLRNEHQLSSDCEIMKELEWVLGEGIDGHVVLGFPQPKKED